MSDRSPGREPSLNRRDFVKSTALAAAAPTILGTLPVSAFANVAGLDTLRVGLIGCGGRGTGAAMQALNADPGAQLVAMADVFADRIEGALSHLRQHAPDRVKVDDENGRYVGVEGYRDVIRESDVVILTTPPYCRPAHLKAAVDAGCHVFCEKPVAVDAAGVRSVLESAAEAKRKGLALVSGFCWRYSDPERATFAQIHQGRIGTVRAAYTTYNTAGWVEPKKRRPEWSDFEYYMRNWHYFTPLSGDHIAEQACHSIDKIAWAMNGRMPARAVAVGGRQMRELGNVYDHFSITFEYDDGARGFHMCRHFPNTPWDNSDYIMGEKGTCFINGWTPTHEIKGENPWTYEGQRRDMYQTEHDELFASIRNGTPINDGEWMAHSTLMSIMGRLAAYTGQTVTWEQALNSQEQLAPTEEELKRGELRIPPVAMPGRTALV